jgi:hypothetical protein
VAKRNVRRNAKYNHNERLLRTLGWVVVIVAFAIVSHPATVGDQKTIGIILAATLGATLVLTRDR